MARVTTPRRGPSRRRKSRRFGPILAGTGSARRAGRVSPKPGDAMVRPDLRHGTPPPAALPSRSGSRGARFDPGRRQVDRRPVPDGRHRSRHDPDTPRCAWHVHHEPCRPARHAPPQPERGMAAHCPALRGGSRPGHRPVPSQGGPRRRRTHPMPRSRSGAPARTGGHAAPESGSEACPTSPDRAAGRRLPDPGAPARGRARSVDARAALPKISKSRIAPSSTPARRSGICPPRARKPLAEPTATPRSQAIAARTPCGRARRQAPVPQPQPRSGIGFRLRPSARRPGALDPRRGAPRHREETVTSAARLTS